MKIIIWYKIKESQKGGFFRADVDEDLLSDGLQKIYDKLDELCEAYLDLEPGEVNAVKYKCDV